LSSAHDEQVPGITEKDSRAVHPASENQNAIRVHLVTPQAKKRGLGFDGAGVSGVAVRLLARRHKAVSGGDVLGRHAYLNSVVNHGISLTKAGE
jgi:hypothetical protein